MNFVFKRDDAAAQAAGIGGITTGVYKLTVAAVVLESDKAGNPRANFYFEDANGKRAIVFGMCIAVKWTTGSDNSDYKKWQEFAALCNMQTGATAQVEVQVSKDKKELKTVFTECTGKVLTVALQETFDVYNGKESNEKSIYRTFNADGKSLAEISQNTPAKTIESIRKNLKPYETKAFKAFKAGGGDAPAHMPDEESSATNEDLI